jgi:hypothetical protein
MAELVLPSGHVALVDDEDIPPVLAAGPWRAHRRRHVWYVNRSVPGMRKRQYLHSFLTSYPMTDHANGNGLDNRRINLRPCTAAQNNANRIRVSNRAGFRGVFRQPSGRWKAVITYASRSTHLGTFNTAEEAARAYDAAAIKTWGEYARPNFPTERAW